MDTIRLGNTGLNIARIGAGCWPLGGPFENLGEQAGWPGTTDEEANDALHTAYAAGVNLFDTADVYGLGRSELRLGRFLKEIKNGKLKRAHPMLSTKVGYWHTTGHAPFDPLNIRTQLASSLSRLGVEKIDIYWIHHPNFGRNDQWLERAVAELHRVQESGQIRFIGLRGPHSYSMDRRSGPISDDEKLGRFFSIAKYVQPDVVSVRYNLINGGPGSVEQQVVDWAKENDIGLFVYKPLAQGLLIGTYPASDGPLDYLNDHRSRKPEFHPSYRANLDLALARAWTHFSCNTNQERLSIVLAYIATRCPNSCILVGFRTATHIYEASRDIRILSSAECLWLEHTFREVANRF